MCTKSKKGMFILDLETPYEMPRVLQHITKWEVADVQWNPHIERQNWIASSVIYIYIFLI